MQLFLQLSTKLNRWQENCVASCRIHVTRCNYSCNSQLNLTDGKRIAWQVVEYMLHAATYFATLRKVESWSTFPTQWNFSLQDVLGRGGVTRAISSATGFATLLRCKLQKIIASCNSAFSETIPFIWSHLYSTFLRSLSTVSRILLDVFYPPHWC